MGFVTSTAEIGNFPFPQAMLFAAKIKIITDHYFSVDAALVWDLPCLHPPFAFGRQGTAESPSLLKC